MEAGARARVPQSGFTDPADEEDPVDSRALGSLEWGACGLPLQAPSPLFQWVGWVLWAVRWSCRMGRLESSAGVLLLASRVSPGAGLLPVAVLPAAGEALRGN